MTRTLKTLTPMIMVLLLNACAPKLMPQELVVEPAIKNELVVAKHNGLDVVLLISRIGENRNTAVVISGLFLPFGLKGVLDPKAIAEDFRSVREENAFLVFRFSCGRVFCEATSYEKRRPTNSFEQDWWYLNKFNPAVPKADKDKWLKGIMKDPYQLQIE